MVRAILFPFLYSVIAGWSWSCIFHKRFSESLAPAFILHGIIVLICGMLFDNLSVGYWLGIILFLAVFILHYCRRYFSIRTAASEADANGISSRENASLKGEIRNLFSSGLLLFVFLYLFCYLDNTGKYFQGWDEFSHWGMFIKECIRTDRLYCTSSLSFAHKDYVPFVTLFEYIWCRLSGRYRDADVYRGIQILMLSMLLPVFDRIMDWYQAKRAEDRRRSLSVRLRNFLLPVFAAGMVLFIPFLFRNNDFFYFYHSIYLDYISGVFLFYCVYLSLRYASDLRYQTIVMCISLTGFVLTKMVDMAFVPPILLLLAISNSMYRRKEKDGQIKTKCRIPRIFLRYLMMAGIPVGIWLAFNRYVQGYLGSSESGQSYSGMKFSLLFQILAGKNFAEIPYLEDVRETYVKALFTRNILAVGSYIPVILICALLVVFISRAYIQSDQGRVRLTALWIVLTGLYYAVVMYFLYATAFSEYEAAHIASFERYMNSFAACAVYLTAAVFLGSDIWKKKRRVLYGVTVLMVVSLPILNIHSFPQILPGMVRNESETEESCRTIMDDLKIAVQDYTENNGNDLNQTDQKGPDNAAAEDCTEFPEEAENVSFFIVTRGDNGKLLNHLRYYCDPLHIDGNSVGPKVNDADIWSQDLTQDELIQTISDYDYLYLNELDDAFIEKYAAAFGLGNLQNQSLYRIEQSGSGVSLIRVD